jgi:MYXO-CTERM domain-containing protein
MRPRAARLVFGVAVVVLGLAQPAAASCDDPFGNPDDVLDFHLQLTAANWAAFQASETSGTSCDDQYPYFPAEFRCGAQEPWLSIGFRRKRDRSETLQKLPIKLDFNRNVSGQRWPAARGDLGFRKLSLNSGQSDDAGRTAGMGRAGNPGVLTAILTEHLAWRLMRQEIPEASGVAYARLTLHFTDTGETRTQGLYVLVEDIDRTAIRARFGADQGLLVKTTDLGCVDEVEFDDGAPNAASDLFAAWLAARPADFPGGWTARTDEAMHLDELLRQEALRELLANTGDTVLGNRNNYYAFDPSAGRRWYLPWDLDDMFRPFPQVRAADTPLVHACTGGIGCTPNPIGAAIRDNAEIRPRYLEIMCRLASGVARESKLLADLQALDALIRPLIETEVPVLWTPAGKNPLDVSVEGTYASEVERMKTWIPARVQAVRRLIEAEGVACPASCQEGATATCAYFGLPSQRACAGGVWGDCERITVPHGNGGTSGSAAAPGGASGATGLAGTGGASGSGTTGGSGGLAGAASSSPPGVAGVSGKGSGCGCTIESPTDASPWFLLVWLILVAGPPRRRE